MSEVIRSMVTSFRCASSTVLLRLIRALVILNTIADLSLVVSFVPKLRSGRTYPSSPQRCHGVFMEKIGIYSIDGEAFQRPQKVNQDAHFQFFTGSYTCVGVLDGHGLKGHLLTEYLAKQLPIQIQQQLQSPTVIPELEEQLQRLSGLPADNFILPNDSPPIHQALVNSFHAAHWDAMQNPDIPAGRNGATCIVCLMNETHIHVAFVGDSRAIRVSSSRVDADFLPGGKKQLEVAVSTLTTETTVQLAAEKARIKQGEGTIRGTNVFYGPVGIAMTRALGNAVMLRAGVVPTPMVETFLRMDGESIILATDGVWDVLSNQQVGGIVADSNDVEAAAKCIADTAKQNWIGDLPIADEASVDDITCIVVR
jgi:serine/threonine protein phosphatase PrpC